MFPPRPNLLKSSARKFLRFPNRSAPASNWAQLRGDAPLDIHPEVQDALAAKRPVVALETALVTHGFPYPENIELAMSLEDIVRSTGSIPATISVIGGRIKVGMDRQHFERLADKQRKPAKLSRRDLGVALALKVDGGTTCSATLACAALVGIKVFATGGLGGVHRGGEKSMDVSADLGELSRYPVGLVSSGVKSILDIRRTLEYLETLGVPVVTYGTTREFPAFFSRHSGVDAPWNVNDPITAAKILHSQWNLGINNGALIAVPIPEQHEEAGRAIQLAVDQAVAESEKLGIDKLGKDVTPWLLTRIGELTAGSSLSSNIALLQNTARVGGQIAVEYQKLSEGQVQASSTSTPDVIHHANKPPLLKPDSSSPTFPSAQLIIVGSAAVDITAQSTLTSNDTLKAESTAPGIISVSLGGVARNIAEACHRALTAQSSEISSMLVSPIGEDIFGTLMVEETKKLGMRTDGLILNNKRTALCNMVLEDNGNLVGGVADMGITASLEEDQVLPFVRNHKPLMLVLDGNLSPKVVRSLVVYCLEKDIKVFFEPTSIIKSTTILPAIAASLDLIETDRSPIAFTSPNLRELTQMFQTSSTEPFDLTSRPSWWNVVNKFSLGSRFRMDLEQLARQNVSDFDSSKGTLGFLINEGVAQMAVKLLPFFQHLVIKCGERGVIMVFRISQTDSRTSPWAQKRSEPSERYIITHGVNGETLVLQHFPALPIGGIVNVTGAGDSLVGAFLANLIQDPELCQDPKALQRAVFSAQRAAILSLQSSSAVSPSLSGPEQNYQVL